MKWTAHIDGGARGNPGPAAAAGVIRDDSGRETCFCAYLGVTTNNVAEYLALIWVLEEARRARVQQVRVCTDSELLVRQVAGAYRVKSPRLIPLYRQVRGLLRLVPGADIQHVPREENRAADALVNRALDWAARYVGEDGVGEQADARAGRPPGGGGSVETGT